MKIKIRPAAKTNESSFYTRCLIAGVVDEAIPVYSFSLPDKEGVYAEGLDLEGGFVVLKGSLAALHENSKLRVRHKKLRKTLIEKGVLVEKEHYLEFTQPCLFKNEYEATCVIAGNNNCRTYLGVWTNGYGRTPLENRLTGISEIEIGNVKQ